MQTVKQFRSTKLPQAQIRLLNTLSRRMSKKEAEAIEQLVTEYYAQKADKIMDKIWDERGLSQADMDALLGSHVRTPYDDNRS